MKPTQYMTDETTSILVYLSAQVQSSSKGIKCSVVVVDAENNRLLLFAACLPGNCKDSNNYRVDGGRQKTS